MGAEMEFIFVVLVCLCLVVLLAVAMWQNKTIAELSSWIDMLERRLDKVQELADHVRISGLDVAHEVGRLQVKVEHLEKETRR